MAKLWEDAVRRAQSGDRQAFESLVKDFSGYLYHIAYGALWQVQDAEDVVQETFMKAYTHLVHLRDPRAFPTWLGRIALNLARNRLRRSHTGPLLDPLPPAAAQLTSAPDPPAEVILALETRSELQAAIAALPEHYRTPLLLRVKGGLAYQEIAEILEIPPGTVRSRIHAARARLAAALALPIEPDEPTKEGNT